MFSESLFRPLVCYPNLASTCHRGLTQANSLFDLLLFALQNHHCSKPFLTVDACINRYTPKVFDTHTFVGCLMWLLPRAGPRGFGLEAICEDLATEITKRDSRVCQATHAAAV